LQLLNIETLGYVVCLTSTVFQEVANKLAKLAVRACARLGGYLTGELETPNNSVTQEILNRLLTPYLARQLSLDKPEEVSKARI
jgi:DnaJ family protein C protein 13